MRLEPCRLLSPTHWHPAPPPEKVLICSAALFQAQGLGAKGSGVRPGCKPMERGCEGPETRLGNSSPQKDAETNCRTQATVLPAESGRDRPRTGAPASSRSFQKQASSRLEIEDGPRELRAPRRRLSRGTHAPQPHLPRPAAALVAVEFPQPIAPPAGKPRSGPQVPVAETQTEAVRGTRDSPSPAPRGDPHRPTRHRGNRGTDQCAASCAFLGRALVAVQRGREFKVGLGGGVMAEGVVRSRAHPLALPSFHLRSLSSCPLPVPRMWRGEEVTGNTCSEHPG